MSDELFEEASERLTIQEVWRDWGLADVPRDGTCLVHSPFRVDGKPSFSIYKSGHLAQDKASVETIPPGKFAYLANDATGRYGSNREVRERVIELAGLGHRLGEQSQKSAAEREQERKARRSKAERELGKAREKAYALPPAPVEVPVWSNTVRDVYESGLDRLVDDAPRIARDRGWPVEWVEQLAAMGKMSKCPSVWGRDGKGYRSFVVECPEFARGGALTLKPVGYHQRLTGSDIDWVFVPYAAQRHGSTALQKHLHALGRNIPALPFVLGRLESPRAVMITEGQWDAISLWGSLGGFSDSGFDAEVAVFGLRGVQGREVFLSHYLRWLLALKHRPQLVIFPDNDAAGRQLIEERETANGTYAPSFRGQLAHWMRSEIIVSYVSEDHGKDFNDLWKAVRPSPAATWKWLEKKGLKL